MAISKYPDTDKKMYLSANYFIGHVSTIRETAKYVGCSKSGVEFYFHRLKIYDYELYKEVRQILDFNKKDRCRRGMLAMQLSLWRRNH